jgi:hypothetical protein
LSAPRGFAYSTLKVGCRGHKSTQNLASAACLRHAPAEWHSAFSAKDDRERLIGLIYFFGNGNRDKDAAAIWEMSGTTVLAKSDLVNPGPTWHI